MSSFPIGYGLLPLALLACSNPDIEGSDRSEPMVVDADNDGYVEGADCDDGDASIRPDADETCDGIDNNCDGVVDGDDAVDRQTFFADLDGDGFGDPDNAVVACEPPEDWVVDASDCDDSSAAAHPGGTEVCDRLDNDCDGTVDFDGWIPDDWATLGEVAALTTPAHVCVDSGTWTAAAVAPSAALVLEGVGIDATVIEGANDIFFVTSEALTLRGLTVAGVGHDGTSWSDYGSFAYALGPLTLDDVRFDAPMITHDNGTLIYAEDADVVWRDVDVDSATVNIESTWYGLVYVYDGLLDLDGVVVHDGAFAGTSSSYGTFYQEYARTNMNDVVVEDNTFDFRSLYGLVWCSEESDDSGAGPDGGDTASTFSNVRAAGNTLTLDSSFYGTFSLDDYAGFYRMQNIEIVGNVVTAASRSYGWLGYNGDYADGYGNRIDNLIIAGNHQDIAVGDAPLIYDFADVTGSNWDLAYNTRTAPETGPLVDVTSSWTLRNLNLVDNDSDVDQPLIRVAGTADVDYCNVRGSDSAGLLEDTTGPATASVLLDVEPDYTSTSGDAVDWVLTPAEGSALIDAGDPDILDADGTRSDLGAFGGPRGDSWLP